MGLEILLREKILGMGGESESGVGIGIADAPTIFLNGRVLCFLFLSLLDVIEVKNGVRYFN